MTDDEKMKIFEDQVLKVGEALKKCLEETRERLTPVIDAIAKAAAVCMKKDCTDCILDGTDACTRGAGRAVDNEICDDFLEMPQDATEAAETHDFKEGELIVYVKGTTAEIGEIKRLCSDGAFVWYHEGDTASKTPFENMHKLQNAYCIKQTSLAKYRPRCESCKHFSICSAKKDIEATTDASKCNDYTEE